MPKIVSPTKVYTGSIWVFHAYIFIIHIIIRIIYLFVLCMTPHTFLALLWKIREGGVVQNIPTGTTIRTNLYYSLRMYNHY